MKADPSDALTRLEELADRAAARGFDYTRPVAETRAAIRSLRGLSPDTDRDVLTELAVTTIETTALAFGLVALRAGS